MLIDAGHHKRSLAAGLLVLVAVLLVSDARGQRLSFDHLSGRDGLAHAHVETIFQDRLGFMWFGTWGGGLNRYDGNEFVLYRHNPADSTSLPNNNITRLFEDSRGDLWISSWRGISRYDRARDRFQNWWIGDENNLLEGPNVFVEDAQGAIWIGTYEGLNRLDRATGMIDAFVHDPEDPATLGGRWVRDVVIDRQKRLWVATENGLSMLEPGRTAFRHFRHDASDVRSLQSNELQSLLEDSRGNLWVGTANAGLAKLALDDIGNGFQRFRQSNQTGSLSTDRIRTLFEDRDGRLWIGSENGGLNIFDFETSTFTSSRSDSDNPRSLSHDSVRSIYQDHKGDVWFGTYAGGVSILRVGGSPIEHYSGIPGNERSLKANAVTTFHEDPSGQVWVGTDGGGFHLFDSESGQFVRYNSSSTNARTDAIFALQRDARGDLWVGGWGGGLGRFDVSQNRFVQFLNTTNGRLTTDNVFGLANDKSGYIWVASFGGGLVRLDPTDGSTKVWRAETDGLNHDEILAVVPTESGKIVVALQHFGLNVFDPHTETFRSFRINYQNPRGDTSLSDDAVQSLVMQGDSIAWVGTQNGLNRLDLRTRRVEQLYESDGLPSSSITGLVFDDAGYLWIATSRGLCRFDIMERTCDTYTVADGLQSNDFTRFAYLKASDGSLYFGGVNGFNRIHPERLRKSAFVPPVVLTDFQLFSRPVGIGGSGSPLDRHISVTDRLTLDHTQNVMTFAFAALDFTAPRKIEYAYWLEGFEADWNFVGNKRSATYSNLNPGTYTLHIKATNADGVWNDSARRLVIVVTPPFWQTWWFRLILGMFLLAGVVVIAMVARRIGQTETIRERLKTEEALREQAQAASEAKGDFLANMSHEIRTPMNGVIGMIDLALELPMSDAQREYLTVATTSAASLLTVINDILDFSKIEAGKMSIESAPFDLEEHVGRVVKSLALHAHQKGLALHLDVAPDVPAVISADAVRLSQILTNLIGNAIKFTEDGEIVISIARGDSAASAAPARPGQVELVFTVRDSGIGIPPDQHQKIFDAFEQADTSTTREFGGTGLGLSITSRIVRLMGGAIRVESAPGEGSTFRVSMHVPVMQDARPRSIRPGTKAVVVGNPGTGRDILSTVTSTLLMEEVSIMSPEQLTEWMENAEEPSYDLFVVSDDPDGRLMDGLRRRWGSSRVGLLAIEPMLGSRVDFSGPGRTVVVMRPFTSSELLAGIEQLQSAESVDVSRGTDTLATAATAEEHPPLRILLAEDNVVNQRILVHMLTKAGHVVDVAPDGEIAVEKYSDGTYDLILMDVQMPRVNGYEATRRIRAIEDRTERHTPILALTARAMKGDRERCIEAGMDDYLTKPVRLSDLREAVSRTMTNDASPAEMA